MAPSHRRSRAAQLQVPMSKLSAQIKVATRFLNQSSVGLAVSAEMLERRAIQFNPESGRCRNGQVPLIIEREWLREDLIDVGSRGEVFDVSSYR